MLVRGLVGLAFVLAGSYVGYFATHPIDNVALTIAAGLFTMGGLIIDLDNVGRALVRIGETKISLPISRKSESMYEERNDINTIL